MKVGEIMETEVITATPGMSVRDVASLMYEHDLSSLPVIKDDGTLAGIISESDLVHRLARPHIPPHIELLGGIIYFENPFEMKKEIEKMTAVTAAEIMTKPVMTASEDAELEDVATLMVDNDINGMPVVKGGMVIGIITRHDLLTALAKGSLEQRPEEDKDEEETENSDE